MSTPQSLSPSSVWLSLVPQTAMETQATQHPHRNFLSQQGEAAEGNHISCLSQVSTEQLPACFKEHLRACLHTLPEDLPSGAEPEGTAVGGLA